MPFVSFRGCKFVGPIVNVYGDAAHPERAARFVDCVFRDDPALSPTGKVYFGGGTIAGLDHNPNVHFSRCAFRDHALALP